MDPLARARAFLRGVDGAAADEVVPVPLGSVLRTPSLPQGWSVNHLRVEGDRPELTLAEAAAAADAQLGALPYRHVLVEDEPTGQRLAGEARAAAWTRVETELIMLLARPSEITADTSVVREGTLEEVLALNAEWVVEDEYASDAATVAELGEMTRRQHLAGRSRHLVAEHDGRAAAMASVRTGDGIAQLEDVFVRKHARGSGLGGAVLVAALELARPAEVVFIVADDDDWPKELYARLGFDAASRRFALHRDL